MYLLQMRNNYETNDDMRFINENRVCRQKLCDNYYYQIVINKNRISKGFPPMRVERNINKNFHTIKQAKQLRNSLLLEELRDFQERDYPQYLRFLNCCRWLEHLDLDLPVLSAEKT